MGELEWGPARSERNIRWIEDNCYIPEGKHVGKRVKLSEFQKKIIRGIYNTLTRTAIFCIGRKNAKTTLGGFLLLLHTAGPEARRNSQLNSAAQSKDQAALLYSLAAKIVRLSPELSPFVICKDSVKHLICPELGTIYRALAAEASTTYGLSSVFTVHDELGQVKGPTSELYEALETSAGAHDDPLSIIISTQATTDGDLLSILIDDALAGYDPTVKVFLYTFDEDDPKNKDVDPFSEEAIKQANPAYGDFLNPTETLKKAHDAKRMPSKESSYRNLILNQRVEAQDPFVSKVVWKNNGTKPESLKGRDVYGGLDLSSVSDLTSLELMGHRDDGWDVESTFWLPEEGLVEKSKADRVPYDVWAKQGFLQTVPGPSIEYEWVAKHLRQVFDEHNVIAIAFDRWNIRHLVPWLEKEGFSEEELEKFINFGQGFQSMSPALRELESLLLTKKIRHGNHPVLTMCAANARVQTDPAGNRKFTKAKSSGRIDGIVALAQAVGVLPEQVEDIEPSIYETQKWSA